MFKNQKCYINSVEDEFLNVTETNPEKNRLKVSFQIKIGFLDTTREEEACYTNESNRSAALKKVSL